MARAVVMGAFVLASAGCGLSGGDPEAEAKAVVEKYLNATVSGDTGVAFDTMEPAWVDDLAKATGKSRDELKKMMAEAPKSHVKSFAIENAKKVSDTEYEFAVKSKEEGGKERTENLRAVNVSGKWYVRMPK